MVSTLGSGARGQGFDPGDRREKLVVRTCFIYVICRDDTKKVCHSMDWDVNWRPLVQGESQPLPVQVKDPSLFMLFAKPECTRYTCAKYSVLRVKQYQQKER